jgi:hypothetical protein
VLQVVPGAELPVIEAAYRALAKLYHPDVNDSAEAHERMSALNQAFEWLKDDANRAAFTGKRPKTPPVLRTQIKVPTDAVDALLLLLFCSSNPSESLYRGVIEESLNNVGITPTRTAFALVKAERRNLITVQADYNSEGFVLTEEGRSHLLDEEDRLAECYVPIYTAPRASSPSVEEFDPFADE